MLKQLKGIDEKKFYLEEAKGFVYEINLVDGSLKQVHFGSIRIKRSKKNDEIKMISYLVGNSTYQLGEEEIVCEIGGTYRFWVTDKNEAMPIYMEFITEYLKTLEEMISNVKKNMTNTIL